MFSYFGFLKKRHKKGHMNHNQYRSYEIRASFIMANISVSNHSPNDILNLQREETIISHESSKRPNHEKRTSKNYDSNNSGNVNRKNKNSQHDQTIILDQDDDVIVIDDNDENNLSSSSRANNNFRHTFFGSQPNISARNNESRRRADNNESRLKPKKSNHSSSRLSGFNSSLNNSPSTEEQTKNDEMMARRLQEELDREYQNHIQNMNQSSQSRFIPDTSQNRSQNQMRNNFRIPDTMQQDLLDSVVRETALRSNYHNYINLDNSDRINYFNSRNRNQSDSVSNLTQAFRFLNDERLLNQLLSESNEIPITRSRQNFNQRNIDELFNERARAPRNSQSSFNNNQARNAQNSRSLFFLNQIASNRDFTSDDYEQLLRLDEMNSNKKGLSKNELDSLISFEFKATSQEESNNTTCSICYEDFVKKDKLTALSCLHKFHRKCIKQWLVGSRKCPLCQKDAINGN